tara:strand:- start:501 stop:863 length:363 start_codon:yes stop_codon:yes gene_type:complete
MLTFFKKIFVWWNQETLGTKLYTFLFGKLVGKDEFGNSYYENKKKSKRWVIYKSEIDASKIPSDWFSWIHFTKNKIEFNTNQKKYEWQKPHSPNLTGTSKAYHPNKKNEQIKKKYTSWKK